MISKTLSTFAVVAFIAFVTVDVDATLKSTVDVNQLRSMAASSGVSSRSKRASYGIMPGHLRYEEVNQKRVRKNSAEPYAEESGLEAGGDSTVLAELTTEQLYRMLDLLNRIENQEPVDATPHELATLNYLLQSYQN